MWAQKVTHFKDLFVNLFVYFCKRCLNCLKSSTLQQSFILKYAVTKTVVGWKVIQWKQGCLSVMNSLVFQKKKSCKNNWNQRNEKPKKRKKRKMNSILLYRKSCLIFCYGEVVTVKPNGTFCHNLCYVFLYKCCMLNKWLTKNDKNVNATCLICFFL